MRGAGLVHCFANGLGQLPQQVLHAHATRSHMFELYNLLSSLITYKNRRMCQCWSNDEAEWFPKRIRKSVQLHADRTSYLWTKHKLKCDISRQVASTKHDVNSKRLWGSHADSSCGLYCLVCAYKQENNWKARWLMCSLFDTESGESPRHTQLATVVSSQAKKLSAGIGKKQMWSLEIGAVKYGVVSFNTSFQTSLRNLLLGPSTPSSHITPDLEFERDRMAASSSLP